MNPEVEKLLKELEPAIKDALKPFAFKIEVKETKLLFDKFLEEIKLKKIHPPVQQEIRCQFIITGVEFADLS